MKCYFLRFFFIISDACIFEKSLYYLLYIHTRQIVLFNCAHEICYQSYLTIFNLLVYSIICTGTCMLHVANFYSNSINIQITKVSLDADLQLNYMAFVFFVNTLLILHNQSTMWGRQITREHKAFVAVVYFIKQPGTLH